MSTFGIRKYISSLLFKPPKPLLLYPLDFTESLDKTWITDECFNAWDACSIPNICCKHDSPKYTIIYSHGNNENLLTLRWYVEELSKIMQADVYAFEYPGYYKKLVNDSQLECSEELCFRDAERFVEHIKRISSLPVILFGYSMGCALTLHCASVHKEQDFPHAVVLLAPFVSAASVVLAPGERTLALQPLWSPFDVFVMKSSALTQGHRIFIANGGLDTIVPPAHGAALARWAGKHGHSTYLNVPEATHSTIRIFADVYEQLQLFLENIDFSEHQ